MQLLYFVRVVMKESSFALFLFVARQRKLLSTLVFPEGGNDVFLL